MIPVIDTEADARRRKRGFWIEALTVTVMVLAAGAAAAWKLTAGN